MNGFKITEIQHVTRNGGSPLKAIIRVSIGPVVINGFRVIQEEGRPACVSMPVISWRDKFTNKTVYRDMITFPSEIDKQDLEVEMLGRWKRDREQCKPIHPQ